MTNSSPWYRWPIEIDDFPSKNKLHLSGIFHMLKDQMENIWKIPDINMENGTYFIDGKLTSIDINRSAERHPVTFAHLSHGMSWLPVRLPKKSPSSTGRCDKSPCGRCDKCPSGTLGNPRPAWTEHIPSGKHTKNNGKSPFSMGKSTTNGHFQ